MMHELGYLDQMTSSQLLDTAAADVDAATACSNCCHSMARDISADPKEPHPG